MSDALDILLDLDFAPQREITREPPKGWRNWFSCPHAIEEFGPGVFAATTVWPCEDIAIDKAEMALRVLKRYAPELEYLGAHPVEDAP